MAVQGCLALLGTLFLTTQGAPAPAEKPPEARAWLGLLVRDVPGGCIVTRVLPGPLDGRGLTSPTLCRPDSLETINGQPASAAAVAAATASANPGDEVVITWRAHPNRSWRLVAAADRSGHLQETRVQLGRELEFTATMQPYAVEPGSARWRDGTPPPAVTTPLVNPVAAGNQVGRLAKESGIDADVTRLLELIAENPLHHHDLCSLPMVRSCSAAPCSLGELAAMVDAPLAGGVARPIHSAAMLAAQALGQELPSSASHGEMPFHSPYSGVFTIDFLLNEPRLMLQASFGEGGVPPELAHQCSMLAGLADGLIAQTGPLAPGFCGTLRNLSTVDPTALVAALAHLEVKIVPEVDFKAIDEFSAIPDELAGAIEGRVLMVESVDGLGWVVVGSIDDNRYDMSRLAGVFEPGGNDTYEWGALRAGNQAIIDLTGNDRYIGGVEQGPAGAVLGLAFIDDRSGNDWYSGETLSCGAAIGGAALLLDRAGDDTYEGQLWSLGAAIHGAGLLMDLSGTDVYRGRLLCQGAGGPGGFGALIDVEGNDCYDSRGASSNEDVPGVSRSLSQGFGYGMRNYAAGGIGLLHDGAGDDQYVAGEMAQGCGYWHGLGVLHDKSGNDRYSGNRYSQGAGVHEAFGALLDDAGDDSYCSVIAAGQGVGWDRAAGVLLDRSGDDQYRGDRLSQGSAAQQAIGMLIDLDGSDHHLASCPTAQGESGENDYHFVATGCRSFSLLLDLGGGIDHFSCDRNGGGATATGPIGQHDRPAAGLFGLFIDTPDD